MVTTSSPQAPTALTRQSLIDALAASAPAWLTAQHLPWPARVLVLDTNYLASTACYLALHPEVESQLQLALAAGRAHAYIAAHVPGEMRRAIAGVAGRWGVSVEASAWQVWREVLAPLLEVVDLPIREHLDPAVRDVMRNLYAKGGDPDDLPTAALACFLAPAVLLTEDGVFARVGMALPSSVPAGVRAVIRAGRVELATASGTHTSIVAGQVAVGALRGGLTAARAHPKAALTALAVVGLTGWVIEARRLGSSRNVAQQWSQLTKALPGFLDRVAERVDQVRRDHADASSAAVPVGRRVPQSLEEAAAAVLTRASTPLSAADLHEEVTEPRSWSSITTSHPVTAEELISRLRRHDAFIEDRGDWSIGRPVVV